MTLSEERIVALASELHHMGSSENNLLQHSQIIKRVESVILHPILTTLTHIFSASTGTRKTIEWAFFRKGEKQVWETHIIFTILLRNSTTVQSTHGQWKKYGTIHLWYSRGKIHLEGLMCRRQHRVFLSNVVSLLTKKYDYVLLYERMLYFTRVLTFEWKQKKRHY